jgi:hypothetical protein
MWRRVAVCKNRHIGAAYHLYHQAQKNRWDRNNVSSNYQLKHACFSCYLLLTLFVAHDFHPDNGGNTFLRNVVSFNSHTASHPIPQVFAYFEVILNFNKHNFCLFMYFEICTLWAHLSETACNYPPAVHVPRSLQNARSSKNPVALSPQANYTDWATATFDEI